MARIGRRRLAGLGLIALIAAVAVIANVEVTTKQGVNFEVSTHRLPLYLKGFEFLDRDAQFRQLAREVTNGAVSDEARVLAVYHWTQRRIQPTPAGWPIIDDHILNIVIRGHGTPDQRADVFATLTAYAGVPAFWAKARVRGADDGAILSFARVAGRWIVVDVANGFLFRNAAGALATGEELAGNQALLPPAARTLTIRSTPYPRIFDGLRTPPAPRPLRAELQMPWPRLRHETKRLVGLEGNDGSER